MSLRKEVRRGWKNVKQGSYIASGELEKLKATGVWRCDLRETRVRFGVEKYCRSTLDARNGPVAMDDYNSTLSTVRFLYTFGILCFSLKKKRLKVQKIFSKTFQVHEKHFKFTGNISSSQKSRLNFGVFFAWFLNKMLSPRYRCPNSTIKKKPQTHLSSHQKTYQDLFRAELTLLRCFFFRGWIGVSIS